MVVADRASDLGKGFKGEMSVRKRAVEMRVDITNKP
jgi:hypothetical protein